MNGDEGQAKESKQSRNKSINNVTFQRFDYDFMNQKLEAKKKKKKNSGEEQDWLGHKVTYKDKVNTADTLTGELMRTS